MVYSAYSEEYESLDLKVHPEIKKSWLALVEQYTHKLEYQTFSGEFNQAKIFEFALAELMSLSETERDFLFKQFIFQYGIKHIKKLHG